MNVKAVFGSMCVTALILLVPMACTNIENGYVGVQVDRYGDDRGVQNKVFGPGRYWIGPSSDMYEFPTFSQNDSWTKTGQDGDESFTFQSVEGLSVSADIGFSYLIKRDDAPKVFQKYKKTTEEISNIVLRNMTRDALNKVASTMAIEDIYGKGKVDLQTKVFSLVSREAALSGITVDNLFFIGDIRLPRAVQESINLKISATQKAIQKENELRAAEADAAKAVAQAKGEAEANRLIAESLNSNPSVLKMKWIEKWDGKLPTTLAGDSTDMIVNLK